MLVWEGLLYTLGAGIPVLTGRAAAKHTIVERLRTEETPYSARVHPPMNGSPSLHSNFIKCCLRIENESIIM